MIKDGDTKMSCITRTAAFTSLPSHKDLTFTVTEGKAKLALHT